MRMPAPPSGLLLARAENAARALFCDGQPPAPEEIYAVLRPECASAAEAAEAWDFVLVRLAELQAAADGYPPKFSINERAA